MRVRALYTPFTAKCSRPARPAADQQDETTRAATSHRMLARTSISLDIARRVRLYLAVCVSRVPARCRLFHSRARMRCYALHYRLAIWSIQFVARIVTLDAKLAVLFIFKTRQHAIQSQLLRDVCRFSPEKDIPAFWRFCQCLNYWKRLSKYECDLMLCKAMRNIDWFFRNMDVIWTSY